jgi:hypothetical protein
MNTRNVSQAEEVIELCQVSLSNHGKVVDFPRSRSSVSEVDQVVEQTRRSRGYDSLVVDQEVGRILLLSYVKVEDLAVGRTDLLLKSQLESYRLSEQICANWMRDHQKDAVSPRIFAVGLAMLLLRLQTLSLRLLRT